MESALRTGVLRNSDKRATRGASTVMKNRLTGGNRPAGTLAAL
jgi:hypothetical protein